jgi:hypothetical protein
MTPGLGASVARPPSYQRMVRIPRIRTALGHGAGRRVFGAGTVPGRISEDA